MLAAGRFLNRQLSGKFGDNNDDTENEGVDEIPAPSSNVLDKLRNNFNVFFDTLVLGDELVGVDYILLIRALCHNTTVRHVTVESNFLGTFNTDEIRILLEVVGGMPKLETLRIHYFPEMAMQAKTVANVLHRTKILKEIYFYDLELAGDDYDMEPLGEALENLKTLKCASFTRLGLEEEEDDQEPISPDHIVSSLSNLPMLEEVTITTRRKFEWGDDSLGGLCDSKTLKSITLRNMDLNTSQISSIAESLQSNTSLTYLQLSECGIDMEGWRAIASILPENKSLLHLNLSQCETLDDDACFILGSCMEGNTSLKILQLNNDTSSKVTGKGISSLFRSLETNETLEGLEVSFTAQDAQGYKSVAECLCRNTSLKKLYLENHGTAVSTNGIVAIGKSLESENTILEQLAIMFDGADNNGVLALAQAMQKSSTLKHFTFNRAEYRSHF